MNFFQPPQQEDEPRRPILRRMPPWFGPADNVIESPLSMQVVLFRSDRIAVALGSFAASTIGISFRLVLSLRDELDPIRHGVPLPIFNLRGPLDPAGELPRELFRFGVEFSDGRTATNISMRHRTNPVIEPDGPTLSVHGGGGGGHRWDYGWFLWPLPPRGPLAFVCEWPLYDLPETRIEVSADELVDAASNAIEVWTDDRPFWIEEEPVRGDGTPPTVIQ